MQPLVLTGLLLLLLLPVVTHGATPRLLTAIVQHVSDGDSVTARSANGTKLRLLGIDAPEISHNGQPGQPLGEDARGYLDHLIGGKTVRVDAYGPDQYKRVLAVLWDDQLNVNLVMVAMGYAEMYRGARCMVHCDELRATETQARQDRVGMWAQGEKYESPRDFRRRLRLQGE